MKYSAHYISGTHWDREWYRPFPEFRFLLVRLLDELLDRMEQRRDFRYFHLDGQTCPLEDYIGIRPENRSRLAKLIREGRILIGPWFTMPDLFCVGDEALIRNLVVGRRVAREWGVEPMPVGFVCDMFGHPSQMPQIFAGFGFRDCVLGRGTNEHTTPMFFHWESPDGSRVFAFKLQDAMGYGAFALPRAAREESLSPSRELAAELEAAGQDETRRRQVREEHCRRELARYLKHEMQRANGSTLCLMDSMDHIPPAPDVASYLDLIREVCAEVEPRHSTLPAFFAEARSTARRVPLRRGELREPSKNRCAYLWLIPNCVSARVRLKQANDACQALLEKWVEPLVALANLQGARIPPGHLRMAWKQLLQNHAHDSICGCSIDQVHRDMMARFDAVRVLAEQLRAQAVGALTARCAELAKGPDEFTLTLVNPLPLGRDEVVIFDVDLPTDYPAQYADGFFTQRIKSFTFEDSEGRPIPYQRLSFVPRTNERSRFARFCFQSDGEFTRYTVAAQVRLPSLGFASLRVKPSPVPVRTVGTLRTGPLTAENEHLAIALESNGTLTLTDKASGQIYRDLLTFEDRSEMGDGWFHGHSLNDEICLSSACRAQVSVVHDGPEIVTFRSTVTMEVPLRYVSSEEKPSEEKTALVISSLISLRRGARLVEIETGVENTAEDHRLRVLFPTDATRAKTWLAHHPFDFVVRPIAVDPQTASWQEMEQAEKPFLHLQAVGDGRRGLAFLSAGGLHEGGVVDDRRRSLQVTLLRSFRKTVSTGGETDGLEQGRLLWRFALLPFDGKLPRELAMAELAKLQTGVFARQSGKRPSGFPPLAGREPSTRGYLELERGNLVVSAIKPAEEGTELVIRLWNPSSRPRSDRLRFWKRVRRATALRLNEEPDPSGPAPQVAGSAVTVRAAPHRIVTVGIQFA